MCCCGGISCGAEATGAGARGILPRGGGVDGPAFVAAAAPRCVRHRPQAQPAAVTIKVVRINTLAITLLYRLPYY